MFFFLNWSNNSVIIIEWVSDMKSNENSASFQLYHGENKLIFNEMMIRSALYYRPTRLVGYL